MKIRNVLLGAALVILSAACQNEIENPNNKPESSDVKLIPVTFSAKSEETKTTLGEDCHSIVWEEGDQICVLDDSELCDNYEAFTATAGGSSAGFNGQIGSDATTFFAVYPYSASTQASWVMAEIGSCFTTTLAVGQEAREDGLPANTNIAVAKADANNAFTFHNVCGVMKFTLEREDIAAIEITPNGTNAPALAGPIEISLNEDGTVQEIERDAATTNSISITPASGEVFTPGTYYVCALPGTYEGGITVTFMNSDTDVAEISNDTALTITAGKIRNLGTIDKNLEFGGDVPNLQEVEIVCETANSTVDGVLTLNNNDCGFTIITAKNNGASAPAYNPTGKDLRIYAKGTITISSEKPITKLVFIISTQGLKRLAPITASVGTIKAQSSGDTVVEWTGETTSVTFTVGDNAVYGSDGSSKAGQFDFTSIDATYLDIDIPEVSVESVALDKSNISIENGTTMTLVPTIYPEDATNKTLNWSSMDESVATVENGVVTAMAVGETTIIVTTADGGFTASCLVTVTPVVVTGISLPESQTVSVGHSVTLTPAFTPANATNQNVTWHSDHPEFATVENGVVTGISEGTSDITVTSSDGGYTATCTVTVSANQKTKLSNSNIVTAGDAASGYGTWSLTDNNNFEYSAFAIKNFHSKATSGYHFLQIKKFASNTAYYVQLPDFGTSEIKSIKMTVSSSSKPMSDGGNTATLYFSGDNSTSEDGDGVASGTGTSSVTIDASNLHLSTGYITANGAVRIWDIEIIYGN